MDPKSEMKIGGYCKTDLYDPCTEIMKLGRGRETTNIDNYLLSTYSSDGIHLEVKWELFLAVLCKGFL